MLVADAQIDNKLWSSLRLCQQEGIKTALSYVKSEDYKKSCLISLPTGAGKSGVICVLAHTVNRKRILVLCHRRSVCDQLISQLKGEFFSKISSEVKFDLKEVYSSIDALDHEGVYVTTFQKLQTLSADELANLKENIDLLLVDEGHSEPSPVWSRLARALETQKIIITATPYRNYVAIYDSRSRNFTSEPSLGLGAAVKVDDLLKLACREQKARTKEAHTSAISTAEKRPESISIRGHDLDRMTTTQSNSSYALSPMKDGGIRILHIEY